jgi:gamma-glutamylcyclotransferase (GGCT)/AIG2-like uncharacterized protein YtfP
MNIFAYGSNMCTARLQARVPSARPLGRALLSGHTLRFHKRGWRDGSGKCDAFVCHDPGAGIWGVVYQIDPAEKPALDRIEGLGRGYDEKRVKVTDPAGRSREAWAYHAHPSAIDATAVAFDWYRDLVLAGALEHDLPGDYVRRLIEGQSTAPDPDRVRARRHRALLARTAQPEPEVEVEARSRTRNSKSKSVDTSHPHAQLPGTSTKHQVLRFRGSP